MRVSNLDPRAVCDAIVALARRSVEQRGELEAQANRLTLLESAVVAIAARNDPAPLEVRPAERTTPEALTRSFEERLAARPDDAD
jgi:hypothetical protein